MKLPEFKIRSSAIGKIMAGTMGLTEAQQKELDTLNDRKSDFLDNVSGVNPLTNNQEVKRLDLWDKYKNPVLPQTAKSYCDTWIKEQIYGRRKEFTSKYTDKGNINEDHSIDIIADELEFFSLVKNEEYFESDFITGTPDIITDDYIIDAKSPWDCFTFPLFATEVPDKDYYYQAQGYMRLTSKKKYKLIYVLTDTPQHIIEKEAFYYCKDNGYKDLDPDVLAEFVAKMTYPMINKEYKIKVFDIEYDKKVIEQIHGRVLACRKYISTQIEKLGL